MVVPNPVARPSFSFLIDHWTFSFFDHKSEMTNETWVGMISQDISHPNNGYRQVSKKAASATADFADLKDYTDFAAWLGSWALRLC